MEICEIITQKSEWVRWVNIIETIHLVLVFGYLVLVGLGLSDCLHFMAGLSGVVVCLAWLDVSVAMSYFLFGKWSSLGLYISMLLQVRWSYIVI